MALNPIREALGQAGRRAFEHPSTFQADASGALASYQSLVDDLTRQVRRGDLTLKKAREQAAEAATRLRTTLHQRAEGHSPVPRVFLDRLTETAHARQRSRELMSVEGLQRETLKLLRQSLIEQQLQTRAAEFEARAFVRPLTGGPAVPTLDSLLAYHETASNAGDDTAREWARRQLEAFRARVLEPADQRRIDLACDRPDQVNPQLVARYCESLSEADALTLEEFVDQATEQRDANSCVAAFLLARQAPEGTRPRWVRKVLDGLGTFPDAALSTLRTMEAEARAGDAEAAHSQADYLGAVAEVKAGLPGLQPPTPAELAAQARIQARPRAEWGQPVGLALDRRGATPEEFAADLATPAPAAES